MDLICSLKELKPIYLDIMPEKAEFYSNVLLSILLLKYFIEGIFEVW